MTERRGSPGDAWGYAPTLRDDLARLAEAVADMTDVIRSLRRPRRGNLDLADLARVANLFAAHFGDLFAAHGNIGDRIAECRDDLADVINAHIELGNQLANLEAATHDILRRGHRRRGPRFNFPRRSHRRRPPGGVPPDSRPRRRWLAGLADAGRVSDLIGRLVEAVGHVGGG